MTARKFLASIALVLITLTYLWVSAGTAHASERDSDFSSDMVLSQSTDARQRAMVCERRPMGQGLVGETVLVCDVPAVKAPVRKITGRSVINAKRVGRTVVVARLGARKAGV